ncbi:MAG: peptidase M28, partial [Bacteroidia bacterium]
MKQLFFYLTFWFIAGQGLIAQTIVRQDPLIKEMVSEVSRDSIEGYIHSLVSFHTRQNLSSQDQPGYGIGAAWKYLYDRFRSNIKQSGGRLSVEYVDYTVGGNGARIPHQVSLKNVVATLRGTD